MSQFFFKEREKIHQEGREEGRGAEQTPMGHGKCSASPDPQAHVQCMRWGVGAVQTEGERRCRSLLGVSPSAISGACAPFPGEFDESKVRSGRHAQKLTGLPLSLRQDHSGSPSCY